MRRAALLGALVVAAGCASRGNPPAAVAPVTRDAPRSSMTPEFQAMRAALSRAEGDAEDARGLRARSRDIVESGVALLRAKHPHDLRRADLPRFLEGRLAFADALKAWSEAAESPDDARVLRAFRDLVDAYWGWADAYRGLPPERSV